MSSTKQALQPLPRMLAANEIIPAIQCILAERRAVRDEIVLQVTPQKATYENVIQPWLDEENRNQGVEAVVDMFRYAGRTREIRDAAEQATKLISDSLAELVQRQDLFLLVKAVVDKDESLEDEKKKAAGDILRQFTNVGHGMLQPEARKAFLDTRKEIESLCQEFNRNLRESVKVISLPIGVLQGVPQHEIQRLQNTETGDIDINLSNRADRLLILRHARNEATRKRLYLENEHKLFENIPLFKKVVVLRDQNARILGFKSHAEFKLQDRIATSTHYINQMLETIRQRTLPIGQEMLAQMKAIKQAHLHTGPHTGPQTSDVEIFPWDFHYYLRLLEEEKKVDQGAISEYFPLQNTILKMLALFSSFLRLRFKALSSEETLRAIWHKDVKVWAVWDDRPEHRSELIGYLFTDVYYRVGKYNGNQNVNLQASYITPDAVRILPATILMCNFSASAVADCPLLRHSEVVTLFHELGHGIHDLLSRTLHTRFHAWRGPVEFGEALSTMLENWCWNKDILQDLSCHYSGLHTESLENTATPHHAAIQHSKRIPEDLLLPLIQNRNLNRVARVLRQISDSSFDMAVHNPASHEAILQLNETSLFNNILEDVTLRKNPDPDTWGPGHCHFGHLMSGYDAGYFAYISAQVFAAEFYETAFIADPRSCTAWDRYRRIVLEAGNSRDPIQVIEEFLGHVPRIDAFIRSIGLP